MQLGRHLIRIEGMTEEQIRFYISTAEQFVEINERAVKKVPTLRGKTVVNLFYEPSTRTRTSFEIAAKRLSADAVNINTQISSVTKGETLVDTVQTIQAMAPDVLVMRHPASGATDFIAKHLPKTAVVNAGDGLHEHPSQALLDALTMKQRVGRLENLTITLVGDSFRSRVARSNIFLHRILGNKIRVVGPPSLAVAEWASMGAEVHHHMESALEGADVVMSLRMKLEYLKESFVPSAVEYSRKYGITEPLLAKYAPKSIVLAPGPFIRGTEVSTEVIDGPRSCYHLQVRNGVATRMAVLFLLGSGSGGARDEVPAVEAAVTSEPGAAS